VPPLLEAAVLLDDAMGDLEEGLLVVDGGLPQQSLGLFGGEGPSGCLGLFDHRAVSHGLAQPAAEVLGVPVRLGVGQHDGGLGGEQLPVLPVLLIEGTAWE
jgi:hypothetical protein